MKKTFLILGACALLLTFSCKKDKTEAGLDNQVLIGEIFKAGMSGYSKSMSGKSVAGGEKSSYPINESIEDVIYGPEGGNIHILGSITGNMNFNDQTMAFTGGILQIGITETISDYAIKSNEKIYTMNGAPYISLAGTFTLQPDYTFGTASSMQIGGGVRTTGDGYDHTSNIQITIIINTNGTGGTVSGTIDGKPVNYTF